MKKEIREHTRNTHHTPICRPIDGISYLAPRELRRDPVIPLDEWLTIAIDIQEATGPGGVAACGAILP